MITFEKAAAPAACEIWGGGSDGVTCKVHGLGCAELPSWLAEHGTPDERKWFAAEQAGLLTFDNATPPPPATSPPAGPAVAAPASPALPGPQPVSASRWPTPGSSPYADHGVGFGPPSLMPSEQGVAELFNAVINRQPVRVSVDFAAVTSTLAGKPTALLGARAMPMPLRIADLVSLSAEEIPWGAQVAHPIMGAGAANTTAEGGAKTEYAAITAGSAAPQTIAVWTDITGQGWSLPNFEAKLRNKLARLVAVRENELLRATVAGTAGIVTQGFIAGDQAVQILRAAASTEASVGVRPDLMLFNPADTVAIFGTAVSNTPGLAELAQLSMRMFGMQSLPLSTQPAGFALVGAWAACSRLVVGLRLTYIVDPYTQLKNNIITVLAEEAVGLAVEEPAGFTTVDIVTP